MAKATTRQIDASGSESESELPKSVKKGTASKDAADNKERDASEEPEQNEQNGDADDDDDGDEEEYEIERILNHQEKRFGRQRGAFPSSRNASDASHSLLIQATSSNGRATARQIIHG